MIIKNEDIFGYHDMINHTQYCVECIDDTNDTSDMIVLAVKDDFGEVTFRCDGCRRTMNLKLLESISPADVIDSLPFRF